MPYSPPTNWVTLRSRPLFEAALEAHDLGVTDLANLAGISRQNVTNIRRGRTKRVREDIGAAIERALGLTRGELFVYVGSEPEQVAS